MGRIRDKHLPHPLAPWRQHLHRIIFGVDTPAGRAFDMVLIWVIVISVTVVLLDSVDSIHDRFPILLQSLEWLFTLLFTAEYVLRLICVRHPLRYAFSLFGLVDLLAILPGYLGLLVGGTQSLLVVRTLRLLRIFRVFKLTQYLHEAEVLLGAVRGSLRKIAVFLLFVLSVAVIAGAAMYLIEGQEGGFTSIPRGMYWAVVTLTTVGYGDIAPQTPLGQALASGLMILGYGVIAVPTGIVTSALVRENLRGADLAQDRLCVECDRLGHDADAQFCKSCGAPLGAR